MTIGVKESGVGERRWNSKAKGGGLIADRQFAQYTHVINSYDRSSAWSPGGIANSPWGVKPDEFENSGWRTFQPAFPNALTIQYAGQTNIAIDFVSDNSHNWFANLTLSHDFGSLVGNGGQTDIRI